MVTKKVLKIIKICECCGEYFEVLPSRSKKRFCSKSCAAKKSKKREKVRIELVCQQCGKLFKVLPSQKERNFCSYSCSGKSRIGKKYIKKKSVILKCQQCHKTFKVYHSREKARFCSKECYIAWRTGRSCPKMKRQKEIVCERCGKTFSINIAQTTRRFCSKKCRGAWMGEQQRGENHPAWNSKEQKCLQCGKTIYVTLKFIERGWGLFCDRKCQSLWQVGENCPAWRGGKSFEPYPSDFNTRLKSKIKSRDKGLCARCGEPGIDVHHIDYDKNNNNPINLILLCKRCHGATNANRKLWQEVFNWHIENIMYGYQLNNSPIKNCLLGV